MQTSHNDGVRFLSEIAQTLAAVDDPDLIEKFFLSILTEKEIEDIGTRWELVRRIKEGQSQRSIAREMNLSLCKITRGSKELQKKDSPFRLMLEQYTSLKKISPDENL